MLSERHSSVEDALSSHTAQVSGPYLLTKCDELLLSFTSQYIDVSFVSSRHCADPFYPSKAAVEVDNFINDGFLLRPSSVCDGDGRMLVRRFVMHEQQAFSGQVVANQTCLLVMSSWE